MLPGGVRSSVGKVDGNQSGLCVADSGCDQLYYEKIRLREYILKIAFGNYYSLRLFWKINYMDNFLLAVRSRRLSINIILRKKEQKENRKGKRVNYDRQN